METEELDVAIEELENRLERLRALYEQYFLGIEKIEPSVARKDVDRRIWLLRREQIRNTAKRFKLQTVIQRYNTFQQYWGRICREIENGTYTRHLIRAQKTVGAPELLTIAARKRLGRMKRDADGEPLPQNPVADVERELAAALENPGSSPLEDAKRAVDEMLGRDSLAAPAPGEMVPPVRRRPPAPATARPAPATARPAPTGFEKLDLEMDFLDGPPSAPAPPASKPRPAALAAARAAAAGKPLASSSSRPAPAPAATHPTVGRPPPTAPVRAAAGRPAPPPPPRAAAPSAPLAPKPAAPAAPRPAPPTAPAPAAPAAPRPPSPSAARPAPARAGGGDDPRLQDLHARLVEAKRRTNDTREVSVDGLRKSLQAAEDRLRKQHGNRKIDFDVVIKDGKAVVKPILR